MWWRSAALTEVDFEQVEVNYIDPLITSKVCPVIIVWIPDSSVETVFEDIEVADANHIVVVGIPCPHQAHLCTYS